ncbi:aldo/keto reductase [Clostridium sp. DJ247]|uniref:aldo/keto reductase n=1 Tax=Clostridium sp. DJ247 TaxID=2726188 RepID=UPI001623FED8|nr:aldo/keto reductase [Clostridium sp. DJ247]MBC2580750.1 aldo/keto reductase [Clostridium sp. DJ247]
MQYRSFGKLDWKVSALGFGCMRLPNIEGSPSSGNINENEAINMIRYAIDKGVNYIDTAYPYHDGYSEIVVGKALKDGYREKVKLATKSPVWLIKKAEDFDKYLDEQLEKLQTDHIDFYLLHALDKEKWEDVVLKFNLLERAEAAIDSGKIKHIGFSFHDNYNSFKTIVDGYDKWDFCQIQYNFMDTENQAGTKGLKYAASKGLAVVIMEPLLGGKLANPPKPVQDIFDSSENKRTPVDWALQWIWNQPEVSLVLSGMSTMEQVQGNITSAKASSINLLQNKELSIIEAVQKKYRELFPIPCTKCSYCLPCPNGVNIPKNFEIYNNGFAYNAVEAARSSYTRLPDEASKSSSCIQCRVCEEKCPQKIQISQWMPKIHSVLGENNSY